MKTTARLLLCFAPLLAPGCAPAGSSPGIEQVATYSPVYPVLVGKTNNPVFRVAVQADGSRATSAVTQITVSLDGTVNLSDVVAVRVFYTAGAEAFSDAVPFGQAADVAVLTTVAGSQTLSDGMNHFWVSLTLDESTNLLHTVTARAISITIDGTPRDLPVATAAPVKRVGRALRQHDDEGVHTYRIPGLDTTNLGTLIAVYDARRNSSVDLQEDVDIGMSRSTDGGQTWEPMKIIMDMAEWGGLPDDQNGIGDPAILVDRRTNTIWVAAVWAHGHPGERNWVASKPGMAPADTSQFMLTRSDDDGHTWSQPINITSQIKDPKWHLILQGPGKGITLRDGTLVFPAQYKDENELPHSTIIYSRDRGTTWRIGTGAKADTTESQVVELSTGALMLNMRDNRGTGPEGRNGTGARSVATTTDLGRTWVEHSTSRTALPEPVCMASLITHAPAGGGQPLLLFSNPVDQFARENMTIKVSEDEGMSWPTQFHTLLDEGRGRGYSCMTSIDAGTIGILYESSQADLVFQKIPLADLMGR